MLCSIIHITRGSPKEGWSASRGRGSMKNIWRLTLLGLALFGAAPTRSEETPVLRVFNWSAYIEIDHSIPNSEPIEKKSPTLSSFMEKHSCRIEYYEYDDEAMMREKILGQPGFFDVACMSISDVKMFLDAGKLARMPEEKVPNKGHLMPILAAFEFDPTAAHFAPYLVGTEGIAYRKDLVGHEVTSWSSYFDPPEHLKGMVGALNSAETMVGAAVKYEGRSVNTASTRDLWGAAHRLRRLKEEGYLSHISSDIWEVQRKLRQGELAMSVLYSGDALSAADGATDGNVVFAIPKEGAQAFMDSWVVFADSANPDLAFAFVNHLLDPEVHARNAAYLNYFSPNEKAVEILRERHPEILNNPTILPPEEVMERLEFQWSGDVAVMNRLWRRLAE